MEEVQLTLHPLLQYLQLYAGSVLMLHDMVRNITRERYVAVLQEDWLQYSYQDGLRDSVQEIQMKERML